jgi:hypothetical protein
LDSEEFMGAQLGGEWVLPTMQRGQRYDLWDMSDPHRAYDCFEILINYMNAYLNYIFNNKSNPTLKLIEMHARVA